MAARPSPVWQWIRSPVWPWQRAAATISLRSIAESGPASTPVLMNPGRMPVPSIPSRHSAVQRSASLLRALLERVRGQVLVLGRAVVAGVGDDVQAARLGEPHQQRGVAAQPGRACTRRACARRAPSGPADEGARRGRPPPRRNGRGPTLSAPTKSTSTCSWTSVVPRSAASTGPRTVTARPRPRAARSGPAIASAGRPARNTRRSVFIGLLYSPPARRPSSP